VIDMKTENNALMRYRWAEYIRLERTDCEYAITYGAVLIFSLMCFMLWLTQTFLPTLQLRGLQPPWYALFIFGSFIPLVIGGLFFGSITIYLLIKAKETVKKKNQIVRGFLKQDFSYENKEVQHGKQED
jgi:hypothetical protein